MEVNEQEIKSPVHQNTVIVNSTHCDSKLTDSVNQHLETRFGITLALSNAFSSHSQANQCFYTDRFCRWPQQ